MKKMMLVTVLVVAFCSASFARKLVAEGKTFTGLGNYKIELADNSVPLKGEDCKAFIISYENSPLEVQVVVCQDSRCKRFVVLSDKLSVQYVCHGTYFGVEKLDNSFSKEDYKTSDSALNRSEYFHQRVISQGKATEIENTRLIAAYFPMLLNNITDVVAIK
jgi:hypothetical protein